MIKKIVCSVLVSLSTIFTVFAAEDSILMKPRKVYVAKTEHFDILFPEVCKETASLLVQEADKLYERAKEKTGFVQDLHIPVVISPDTDRLSVIYTQSPYNRIVIYEAVGDEDTASFKDHFLGLFYHEIYKAVSKAIRNPFFQKISKLAGDSLEPISITNIPFSYVEGRAYLFEGQASDSDDLEKYGRYNDGYFLQILSQAKYEGKFPSYYECSSALDIYPGNELLYAATSAFTAYLIQTYGYEMFEAYWEESGAFHVYLMPGIFYSIYKEHLNNVWNEFIKTVPLPANLDKMEELSAHVEKFFPNDLEGLYQHLLYSEYGYVWYDDIRHEVDLYDTYSSNKLRQLLFLADKIDRMTLSPDGRYLAVSYRKVKSRPEFERNVTWIYDLKERSFLDYELFLRDSTIILSEKGEMLIAGINIEKKHPVLQIFTFTEDEDDSEKIYEKEFEKNAIPSSLCAAGNGKLTYILTQNAEKTLVQENISEKTVKSWKLKEDPESELNITNLRFIKTVSNKTQELNYQNSIYSFQYVSRKEAGFVRMGYINLDENYEPNELYLMQEDLPGGVYYPVIKDDTLYYCAKKFRQNELSYIKKNLLTFESGIVQPCPNVECAYITPQISFSATELDGHELSGYWPLKYMFPMGMKLFLPVRKLSLDEGACKWPGLGASFITNSDPFMNNEFTISLGWTFFKLELTQVINAPMAYILEQQLVGNDARKDKSAAVFYENTSTPVDIKAGALLRFNLLGEYKFEALAGTIWNRPIGTSLGKLNFNIGTYFTASTDYYDQTYIVNTELYGSRMGWPAFNKAYEYFEANVKCSYSNIHQYGISPYETRGFSVGARLYFFWDIYSYRILAPQLEELYELGDELVPNTESTGNEMIDIALQHVTQLNAGLFGEIDIPRLNPLHMVNNFVLSLPTKITAEVFNRVGTAIRVNPEILLLAWEPHDGIRFLYSYFSRIGLKAGYDFRLDYDTYETMLPDIRRQNYVSDTLKATYVNDSIYLKLNIDASATVAILSDQNMGFEFKFIYYPRDNGFVFSFNFISTF